MAFKLEDEALEVCKEAFKAGCPDKAKEALQAILNRPRFSERDFWEAVAAFEHGHFQGALGIVVSVLTAPPENPRVRQERLERFEDE